MEPEVENNFRGCKSKNTDLRLDFAYLKKKTQNIFVEME